MNSHDKAVVEAAQKAAYSVYVKTGWDTLATRNLTDAIANAVLDAIVPQIHADCPRIAIDAALGEPTTCQVWIGGRRVFNGVDLGTAIRIKP